MTTDSPKGSPGPWRWVDDPESSFHECLVDSNGAGIPWEWLKPRILLWAEMASLLRELEWAGNEAVSTCPECGQRAPYQVEVDAKPIPDRPEFVIAGTGRMVKRGGHTPDCRLAALLVQLP